ncbi:MAG: exo-alpha-sialidase [Candidatus Hydrogenedentes bacterium]|nr:exo-alpha-sialidase [Candidatus Hydrogenedentota bacterium]
MLTMVILSTIAAAAPAFPGVPGVVISHIPAAEERYVGSPSIAVLPDGSYVATHDEFGPKSQYHSSAITHVFRSTDKGQTWSEISRIDGAFWSTVFAHRGALYLIGTTMEYGALVIRKSTDGGATWTTPKDKTTGLLSDAAFHCAPVPVIQYKGRLWRGMEDAQGPDGWGHRFRAFMMSVPVDADLLVAANWTFSNVLARDPAWLNGAFNAWLEGNAVVTRKGALVDILRVDGPIDGEKAAIVRVSRDGRKATFNPKKDFVSFPGGSKKFTIRFDPQTKLYWSLSNYIPEKHRGPKPATTRNTLALISSPDLRKWRVRCIVLYHPDTEKHGFQYVDWLFEGDDLIAACRTAFDDGQGGAHNMHDANFLTFHRIKNFRKLTMKDSVANAPERNIVAPPAPRR